MILPLLDIPVFPNHLFKRNPLTLPFIMIKSKMVLHLCLQPIPSPQLQTCFSNSLSDFVTWIPSNTCVVSKYHHHASHSLFLDTFMGTFIQFFFVLNLDSYTLS